MWWGNSLVLLRRDGCIFFCCKLHFILPTQTSFLCLPNTQLGCSKWLFPGRRTHSRMDQESACSSWSSDQPCVVAWKPVCISQVQNAGDVATQPRNAVHSPQSLAFPLKAKGEDMLQLLTVAQILPTGCAKSVHECMSLTATLPSTHKGKRSQGVLLHHPYYPHTYSSFQLTRAVNWERICNKKLPSPLALPACAGMSAHCFYMHAHTDAHTERHV